jgi:hypothetical protein
MEGTDTGSAVDFSALPDVDLIAFLVALIAFLLPQYPKRRRATLAAALQIGSPSARRSPADQLANGHLLRSSSIVPL